MQYALFLLVCIADTGIELSTHPCRTNPQLHSRVSRINPPSSSKPPYIRRHATRMAGMASQEVTILNVTKERREREEKQRQQSKDLFKTNQKLFIEAINNRKPIVCKPPIELVSTTSDTSVSGPGCQSDNDLNSGEFYGPTTLQDHIDHLKQARMDLTELKTFCIQYVTKN